MLRTPRAFSQAAWCSGVTENRSPENTGIIKCYTKTLYWNVCVTLIKRLILAWVINTHADCSRTNVYIRPRRRRAAAGASSSATTTAHGTRLIPPIWTLHLPLEQIVTSNTVPKLRHWVANMAHCISAKIQTKWTISITPNSCTLIRVYTTDEDLRLQIAYS